MIRSLLSFGASLVLAVLLHAVPTETQLLSGTGPDDAVAWDFFCTDGRNSRVWSKIPVPSCWEQHGFGTYNYGGSLQYNTGDIVGHEQGLYRRTFTVPAAWQGRVVRLVFDGSMTDTSVWINGTSAGPTHQGAFYRFHYDITPLVRFGAENLIEVTVAKNSSNRSVNDAERAADYWVFGGIYRPVWLEALPPQFIDWTAIDARADGSFLAEVHLGAPLTGAAGEVRAEVTDLHGRALGSPLTAAIVAGETKAVVRGSFLGVRLWTAETPHLHRVRFTLTRPGAGDATHEVTERFGFRTIEVRENDGVYLNGTRIVLKGVNRHCFWPETARTVSREQSYADASLIKAANMNAVRMSHYPPDKHFLEACDELGLYVLDELGGWQKPYDIKTGARLIGQLVRRDVNHPCILFWDNGNEGGWKAENDAEFAKWDPQKRAVLHPWATNSGINTDHYEKYDSTVKLSAGPQLFMPTEFLHGLWDGGIGAGMRDYWDVMGTSPTVAGGFFWVWSDEGVVRTDRNNTIDNAGNQAPDGMVGPHRELEGSYFTVKEIWSPVQVTAPVNARGELPRDWDGTLTVENQYAFTNLSACRFEAWLHGSDSLVDVPLLDVPVGDLAPGMRKTVRLVGGWTDPRLPVLTMKAWDPQGRELWAWSWFRESEAPTAQAGMVETHAARPDPTLQSRPLGQTPGQRIAPVLPAGPRLVAYRYANKGFVPVTAGVALGAVRWTDLPDGGRRCDFAYTVDAAVDILGVAFDLPEAKVKAKRWLGRGPYRVYRNRMEGVVIDVHEVAFNDPIPGESFTYPEFKGYFREWRWLELDTVDGRLRVENLSGIPFYGLYAPRDGSPSMQAFPDTGLALLEVIPAIGSKFAGPETTGPRGVTPHVRGERSGSVVFRASK
ncbi:MAG: glycoside hydrolase family 2 [Opitutaceae bacterium]|nr:glycoside hydrolase family 2 [Opitutaceae bacterium]